MKSAMRGFTLFVLLIASGENHGGNGAQWVLTCCAAFTQAGE